MRILHGEIIVTSKQTSAASVATASGKAKKRKLSAKETRELRALSLDSESGLPHSDDIDSLPPVLDEWTPEQEELAGQFPEHGKAWLAHLVELAKWKVGIREHEELVNELEVVLLRERELKDTNELLLRGIMRQELFVISLPAAVLTPLQTGRPSSNDVSRFVQPRPDHTPFRLDRNG